MLLYVGGINNISKELYEAASVDGAKKTQAFFRITLPLLMPTTFIVLLLSTVNLLKEYALVQGISLGGPGWEDGGLRGTPHTPAPSGPAEARPGSHLASSARSPVAPVSRGVGWSSGGGREVIPVRIPAPALPVFLPWSAGPRPYLAQAQSLGLASSSLTAPPGT